MKNFLGINPFLVNNFSNLLNDKAIFSSKFISLKPYLEFSKMSIQYQQNAPSMSFQAGDPISQLPVDKNPPNINEIHIIDTLFKKHRKTMDVILEEAKDAIIVGLLIIGFCLPQVDNIINKILPISQKSLYFLLAIKGILASIIYWFIKHFYLSRKS
jgi:hypothetical protein